MSCLVFLLISLVMIACFISTFIFGASIIFVGYYVITGLIFMGLLYLGCKAVVSILEWLFK